MRDYQLNQVVCVCYLPWSGESAEHGCHPRSLGMRKRSAAVTSFLAVCLAYYLRLRQRGGEEGRPHTPPHSMLSRHAREPPCRGRIHLVTSLLLSLLF